MEPTGSKLVANDYLDTFPLFGSSISRAPQGDVLTIAAQNNDVTSTGGIGQVEVGFFHLIEQVGPQERI